jgi:hypothetical protein
MAINHECSSAPNHRSVIYNDGSWTLVASSYEIEYCPFCGDKLPEVKEYRITVQEVQEMLYIVPALSPEGAKNRVVQCEVEHTDRDWVKFVEGTWKIEEN